MLRVTLRGRRYTVELTPANTALLSKLCDSSDIFDGSLGSLGSLGNIGNIGNSGGSGNSGGAAGHIGCILAALLGSGGFDRLRGGGLDIFDRLDALTAICAAYIIYNERM